MVYARKKFTFISKLKHRLTAYECHTTSFVVFADQCLILLISMTTKTLFPDQYQAWGDNHTRFLIWVLGCVHWTRSWDRFLGESLRVITDGWVTYVVSINSWNLQKIIHFWGKNHLKLVWSFCRFFLVAPLTASHKKLKYHADCQKSSV